MGDGGAGADEKKTNRMRTKEQEKDNEEAEESGREYVKRKGSSQRVPFVSLYVVGPLHATACQELNSYDMLRCLCWLRSAIDAYPKHNSRPLALSVEYI